MKSPRSLCLLLLPLLFLNLGSVRAGAQTNTPANAAVNPPPPKTLDELLASSGWDVKLRGPLLVVNPDGTRRISAAPMLPAGASLDEQLSAFRRQRMQVGKLNVIAPTDMTQIEEMSRELPNLYDGLRRDLKVKYLLATLTEPQWKQLAENGLGIANLNGEQQAIFLSLLPKPFLLRHQRRTGKGEYDPIDEKTTTLTPEQRAQVRLRVFKAVRVMIPIVGKNKAYASANTQMETPIPLDGERVTLGYQDEPEATLFGVTILRTVPNRAKPGDLNFGATRLNAPIVLDNLATVSDLVKRVGAVTGLELYADPRVGGLPVLLRGESARAGDVLKALALAVTGIFRKVEAACLLTSDRTGIATRQLRWAEWQAETRQQVREREEEMTRRVRQRSGQGGGINLMPFSPDDPLALPPALYARVRNRPVYGPNDIAAAELPPAFRKMLRDNAEFEKKHSADTEVRDDAATITIQWKFAYQLPNGTLLESGEYPLASESEINLPQPAPQPPTQVLPRPAFTPAPLPDWAATRRLFLSINDANEATDTLSVAERLGFTELILRTENKDIINVTLATQATAEAVRKTAGEAPSGLRISVLIAPFAAGNGGNVPGAVLDRNLLGETASDVAAFRRGLTRWQKLWKTVVEDNPPPFSPEIMMGATNALAPIGPGPSERFRQIADIAALPDLAGLYLYDTQPSGYAGQTLGEHEIQMRTKIQTALMARENLGYVPALRLAFLRKSGFDPVDLTPFWLNLDIDLPLPFFPDEATTNDYRRIEGLALFDEMKKARQQWDVLRSEANRKALRDLYADLHAVRPALPLYVAARAEWNDAADARRYRPFYARWTQPNTLPIAAEKPVVEASKPVRESVITPLVLSASELVPARAALIAELERLRFIRPDKDTVPALTFDCSNLPLRRALDLLKECIKPAASAQETAASAHP